MPPLHTISVCVSPPPLSVLLQGTVERTLVPSTVRAYVPLIADLPLRKSVPLRQPLSETATLP